MSVVNEKVGVLASDYALNDDCSLRIENGDFVRTRSFKVKTRGGVEELVNECDQQHVNDILRGNIGGNRFFPLVGVNLASYLNSPVGLREKVSLEKRIRKALQTDVFKVKLIEIVSMADIRIQAQRVKL